MRPSAFPLPLHQVADMHHMARRGWCVCQAWSVHNCLHLAQAHRCFERAFAVVFAPSPPPLKISVASPLEIRAEAAWLGAVALEISGCPDIQQAGGCVCQGDGRGRLCPPAALLRDHAPSGTVLWTRHCVFVQYLQIAHYRGLRSMSRAWVQEQTI